MELIEKDDIIRAAHLDKLNLGGTAGIIMKALRLDRINHLYSSNRALSGTDFVDAVLNDLNITFEVDPADLQKIPSTGPFIAIANHPFGMLDGLLFIRLMGKARPDFKIMANFLLQKILTLEEFFLPVNPFGTGSAASMAGIKGTLAHLQQGSPVGIFPAGEVSTFQKDSRTVADKEWSPMVIRLIQKAQVPVLPVYFKGSNSLMFHLLGMIHPMLRTVKIPSELINKKNKTVRIRIGAPVTPQEQNELGDTERLGRFLRMKTYALGSPLEVKKFFLSNGLGALSKPQRIVEPVGHELVLAEVENLRKKHLIHEQNNFEIFISPSLEIPNIINEIGRLREITFRDVGEGSNKKIDIDEYDLYYHHLFIWDKVAEKIVGAYRMGKGKDILQKFGKKGFYIDSLFQIDEAFNATLAQSIELGRSFIVKEYQQKPLPLFLLWKGILCFLLTNPEYKYLIGPVSISNQYSNLSKGLMIAFIKKYFYDHKMARLIRPRKEFEVKYRDVDPEVLLQGTGLDMNKIDRFIEDIEPARYKIPILLKKYIKLNGRIICFNIDPKFNNALDGLMVLNLDEVPEETIRQLKKEFRALQDKGEI